LYCAQCQRENPTESEAQIANISAIIYFSVSFTRWLRTLHSYVGQTSCKWKLGLTLVSVWTHL